jgi:superfamily II DNA or RNA helicase
MDNEAVDHGVIMAKVAPNSSEKTQLASIQSLWARCEKSKHPRPWPLADLLICDESHRIGSKTYIETLKKYSASILIGVTATPIRTTGASLGDMFDHLIVAKDHGASVRQLMDAGYLAEASYMVPHVQDMSGVLVARGEYVEQQLDAIFNDAKLIGEIVDHFKEYASGRKAIVFAVNVAHSVHITQKFNDAGIPAAHIDGKTDTEVRAQIIKDFSVGKYQVLSNCQVFTEGFDSPEIDCVILAGATKSITKYLQSAGRGLRVKPDGGDCLILDHAGNVLRHGLLDEDHSWSLENTKLEERDTEKKEKEAEDKEVKEKKDFRCASCGNIFKGQGICPKCGTPLPQFAKDMETARGELIQLENPAKKEPKQKTTMQEKQVWWSMFLKYGAEKGYKRGWAANKYRERFKVWPKGLENSRFVGTYPAEFTGYITHSNIRFAKSKRKY